MADLIYAFGPLVFGTLVRRYKRFFAEVALDSGETITAHCANTGPMTGISTLGSRVALSLSDNKKRTLPYSWELIELAGVWVGVNTALPNRVIRRCLEERILPLGSYEGIRPEVPYGVEGSRIDYLLTGDSALYLEIKNTTWTAQCPEGQRAIFPDTVTTRGHKHLRELTLLAQTGVRAAILYFINRGDCVSFSPGVSADPEYARLLDLAVRAGVMVLPYGFEVSPAGLRPQGLVPLILEPERTII